MLNKKALGKHNSYAQAVLFVAILIACRARFNTKNEKLEFFFHHKLTDIDKARSGASTVPSMP